LGSRRRLKKLEREAAAGYTTLHLPDGSEVLYTGEDALDALIACMDQEEHWLVPVLREAGTKEGLPGLIWALEAPVDDPERGGA
jgi:hypothetical protein